MKDQNFLSIDLEYNNKKDGTLPKIIQVGIAIGSPTQPKDIKTFSWYLNPNESITPFITQLTGITDEIIQEKAVSHQTIAQELGELIKVHQCFCNPVVWGGSAYKNDASDLKNDFDDLDINFQFFGHRIIDVKTIFVYKQIASGKSPVGGLRKSMNKYGLKFEGVSHRADVDAKNTLRFFFHFLNTENKTLNLLSQLKEL